MRTGVIAKKLGMSSIFTEAGERIGVTVLYLDKCQVIDQRTEGKNGYNALVVGASIKKSTKVSKPLRVQFDKNKVAPRAIIKEFRIDSSSMLDVRTELNPDHYNVGQCIDVSGTSIGKGFAGVMKRHNFSGLEATHGVSISHRSHGSTGQCQDPGKVFKGKKMAGHMGDRNVTVQNLVVIRVDKEQNLLFVRGNVPGSKGGYVFIRDAVKKSVAI